ncbi:DUF6457 domain-containing protein [Ammonicoccus fulvus]|uniref:DUF6457 domain-containing protein n=1 Tax=Ammonicoccus fulvus TaxID=3138240 RepID=A0ABZ3FPY0_9ACTN
MARKDMPMTEEARVTLSEWVQTLTDRLDTDFAMDEESMHIILDLARDAAHGIARPAAPLTTFIIGLAVGQGASLGAAAAQATELIQATGGPGESESD